MKHEPDEEWVRADAGIRRRAILLIIAFAMLGMVAFLFLQKWLIRLQESGPDVALPLLRDAMAWISVAMGLSMVGFAIYFWRLGRRVVQEQRFPPQGMKVARDTRVVTGPSANRRGWAMQALAAILVVGALAIVLFMNAWILPAV